MSPTRYQTAPPRGGAATLPATSEAANRHILASRDPGYGAYGRQTPNERGQADAGAVVVVVGAVVVVDEGGGLEPDEVDAPGAVVEVEFEAGGDVPPSSCCACATLDCALLILA